MVSNFGYAIMVKNRLELFNYLKKHKVETRPLICGNMGQQPFWLKKHKKPILPNAEKYISMGCTCLITKIYKKQVKYICEK